MPPGRGITPAPVGSPRVECFGRRPHGPPAVERARLRAGATPLPGGAASPRGSPLSVAVRRGLLLICVTGAALLGGCAVREPRVVRAVTAEELLGELAARRAAVTSLRARARLRSGLGGLWTRETLLVRRPDAVRIDVLSPFGLELAVGVQGALLWAYPPAGSTRYEGPASAANLTRFLGAPVDVGDVVEVLLGLPPARAAVGPPALAAGAGEYRLTLPLAAGAQTIWFAGDPLRVRRAEETRDGALALRVGFDDYRDGFPHLVEVAAASGAAARLAYDAVETNAPVDPALFAPPPAARVLPLEAAPAPEAR